MKKFILVWVVALVAWTSIAGAQTTFIPGSGGIPNLPCAAGEIPVRNAGGGWNCGTNTSGGAPTSATYWTSVGDGTLTNEVPLNAISGVLVDTAGTPSQYTGTSCAANRFLISLNASAAATCAQVDVSTSAVVGVLPLANGGNGAAVTPTDDSVLVGNGTILQSKVIPNCSSPTASKLIYDATSNTFGCGIDQNTISGNVNGPASVNGLGTLTLYADTTGKLLTDASSLSLTPGTLYTPLVDFSGGTTMRETTGSGFVVLATTPTLLQPQIFDFTNSPHDHSGLSNGGQLNLNTAHNVGSFGPLTVANGGTGKTACTGCSGGYSAVGSVSPAFTGDPTSTTPPANDNDTSVATTAYVQTEVHEVGGIGSAELANIFGSPQSCTNCAISTDQDGRVTAIATGAGGSGSGITQIGDCISSPCYQTEAQNKVLAAPTGSTGQVTSRLLVDADIPSGITGSKIGAGISATNVTVGTLSVNRFNSGTGASSTTFLRGDGTWQTPAGTGTVTSVDMSVPASSIFAISGNPVTSSGTLALATNGTSGGVPYFSSATQLSSSAALTANRLVLGGGAGAAPTVVGSLGTTTTLLHGNAGGAPTFSAVNLAAGADITGTLTVANGGTGATTFTNGGVLMGAAGGAITATAVLTNGQLLIGDGTTNPTVGTLTGTAAEVEITNGVGTITVGLPDDVTVTHNLSVNNIMTVASQADGSNGLDMFNNTAAMQAGSSGHCNAAFVNSRFSKRCNGVATLTPYANIVAEGTLALNTTIVNTGTCGTAQTVAATGTLTTDVIEWAPNAAVGAPNGLLTRSVYPTADTVNVVVCNPTAGNLTPGAMTINWKVIR